MYNQADLFEDSFEEQQSDDSSIYLNQSNNASMNETAETIDPHDRGGMISYDQKATDLFTSFYKNQLRQARNVCLEKNQMIFGQYSKVMQVFAPIPNLYFLPITIKINSNGDSRKIREMAQKIFKFYKGRAQVKSHKFRPNQIEVKIHNLDIIAFYQIKFHPLTFTKKHKIPQLLDDELSIDPLISFYIKNTERQCYFNEGLSIFMYWAYRKGIANKDFLSEACLKMLALNFYLNSYHPVPNVVYHYSKRRKNSLEKLQKMYTVKQNLQCVLANELFDYQNFTIQQKRSFFRVSTKRYSYMSRILPVPYPLNSADCLQFKKDMKNQIRNIGGSGLCNFFVMIFRLQGLINSGNIVVIDMESNSQGFYKKPNLDFNLQIIHPIFKNNMCPDFTNDLSKIRIFKQEIFQVVKIYKSSGNNPFQALVKIFQQV